MSGQKGISFSGIGKKKTEERKTPANADTSPPSSSGSETPSPAGTPESPSVSCGHHSCGSLFARCAEHGRSRLLQTFTDPESLLSRQTFSDRSGGFHRRSDGRREDPEPSHKPKSSRVYSKYFRTGNSEIRSSESVRPFFFKRHVSLPGKDVSDGDSPEDNECDATRSNSESKILKDSKRVFGIEKYRFVGKRSDPSIPESSSEAEQDGETDRENGNPGSMGNGAVCKQNLSVRNFFNFFFSLRQVINCDRRSMAVPKRFYRSRRSYRRVTKAAGKSRDRPETKASNGSSPLTQD